MLYTHMHTHSGSVYCYALLQLAIWWICHVAALFWKVKFPFHAKAFNNVKFVHILIVVAALLLPVAPVISAFVTGGFTMSSFPPLSCVTKNSNAVYFTLILPISLIVAIGTTLLILILATILKKVQYREAGKTDNNTHNIRMHTTNRLTHIMYMFSNLLFNLQFCF